MAIRAYITKWWVTDPDGVKIGVANRPTPAELASYPSRQIQHPILQWVDNNPAVSVELSMHFPDADADGLPDKDYLLVLVHSPAEIPALATLPDVWAFSSQRFDREVAGMTEGQRNAGFAVSDQAGVPRNVLAGSRTCGEFLKRIAKYLQPAHQGFGRHIEIDRAGEFE